MNDTRQSSSRARVHCLVFTDAHGAKQIVLNSECATEEKARTLLSDRIANGEAFSDERYEFIPSVIYDRYHGHADVIKQSVSS